MFVEQLKNYTSFNCEDKPSSLLPLHSNLLEFQYELCQIFIKKTGQQLHQQESQIMQNSADLLKFISQRQIQKEKCSSTDSGTDSLPSSVEQIQIANNSDRSKRGEGNVWRKLEGRIGSYMSEIQMNCSALCLINIKAIINDYRRLLEKWWELQAREGLIERKNIHFQREHEQNIILKQKMATQNIKIENLKNEVECLRQKNESVMKYANDKLKELLGNHKVMEINDKVYKDIKRYLQEKQECLIRRTLKVDLLEQQLLNKLVSSMPTSSCENCCIMLRKLKESLFKFKNYLEGEGNQLENMFNKYKKTLFSKRSQHYHL